MKTAALALFLSLSVLTTTAAADATVPAGLPANAPTLTLKNPGKGPRKPIRFTATKGMKRALTTLMEMKLGIEMGGRSSPAQKVPVIKMPMDLVVTHVEANGDIRYEFTLREPEIVPDKTTTAAMRQQLAAELKGLAGMTGHAVVTNRGFTREADVVVPKSATAQSKQFIDGIRQSMNQLCAPVPAEDVGVGATWETVSKLEQNGLTLVQTVTTRLQSFQNNSIKLKIDLVQTAKPQKITTNGVTVDLVSFASTGSGDTTMKLEGLIPTLAKVAMHSDIVMDAAGQKVRMILDLAMSTK